MLNSQRIFVDCIKRYCTAHDVAFEVKAQGWLLSMQKGPRRHYAWGYDLGLNSSVAHRIANDKAATSDVLENSGIACVPHSLFFNPEFSGYVPQEGSWEAMLQLLERFPHGLVVKPNEGTGGEHVFKASKKSELELAVGRIFQSNKTLAISPYYAIEEEVRVVVIDYVPLVVYRKTRPMVEGDGVRTALQLALANIPAKRLSAVFADVASELDASFLDSVPQRGQQCVLNWRHNLGRGANPILLEDGAERRACADIAQAAARAITLRFGSVDVVLVDGTWRVLEINSGVMMEAFNDKHPDLVDTVYHAALDKIFG